MQLTLNIRVTHSIELRHYPELNERERMIRKRSWRLPLTFLALWPAVAGSDFYRQSVCLQRENSSFARQLPHVTIDSSCHHQKGCLIAKLASAVPGNGKAVDDNTVPSQRATKWSL
jgi:hypothetical protein